MKLFMIIISGTGGYKEMKGFIEDDVVKIRRKESAVR
jgi:hypothetical protein